MSDVSKKVSENVPGKYYVDSDCIVCGVCESTAPEHFKMTAEHAFVYKQPETDPETDKCEEALSVCPVNAIGNNG